VINLNALLRRRVGYYEYPSAIEGLLRTAQSRLRSLLQVSDASSIFSKSMRSGHRFLTEASPIISGLTFTIAASAGLTARGRITAAEPTATSCRRATISACGRLIEEDVGADFASSMRAKRIHVGGIERLLERQSDKAPRGKIVSAGKRTADRRGAPGSRLCRANVGK
jgi:hypothetical protein